MLRNWITQFGYTAGRWAGDEGVSENDRAKFVDQIGNYFGWNPPPHMNWMVEVAQEKDGKYVLAFIRYATEDEAEKLLGKNYEKANNIQKCKCDVNNESSTDNT